MNESEQSVYQKKMEAKLMKLKADMKQLEAEIKEQKADARLDIQQRLQQLHQRGEDIKVKLHTLKKTSGAAWNQAKDGIASAWNEIEAAFQKARAEFKQQ
ncbi:MAG: hypothetical protein EOM20_04600 [Spartobacteria bacterium]|nr:hypothetical protein [Spartobacteria bacterium]